MGPLAAGLAAVVSSLDARFTLSVANLGIVASALEGTLQASGRLSGPVASLASDATIKSTLSVRGSPPGAVIAEVHARGLPGAPTASIAANGILDSSPLDIAVTLARVGRSGLRAKIERGAWKSAKLEGEWSMESTFADSRGQLHVRVGELGDLDHLLGRELRGKLEGSALFTPKSGSTHAQFELDVEDLAVSQFSGSVHVSGEGSTDAVAAKLDVKSPDVKGYPATLSAEAAVDLEHRYVRVLHAVADYREQKFRLLAPAKMTYAPCSASMTFRVGAQSAVLECTASFRPSSICRLAQSLDPQLINDSLATLSRREPSRQVRICAARWRHPPDACSCGARYYALAADEASRASCSRSQAGADLKGNSPPSTSSSMQARTRCSAS